MATSRKSEPSAAANDTKPAPADEDALSLIDLAKGVLNRDFRPRAASVRRLAEGVLAAEAAAKAKKKKKKSSSAKAGKKRRLATIPGQKSKKKKG